MSRGINKVILIGNLGADPDVRSTAGGKAVANLSIATSESWKDRQTGETRENTEWHRVVFFDRTAEIAGEYLRKGSKVYVEGKLQTRKWQDKDGNDRWTTEILGRDLQMLGDSGSDRPQRSAPPQNAGSADQAPPHDDLEDDIPF